MTPPDLDKNLVRRHFSDHAEEYDRYAVVQKRVADRLLARLPATIPLAGPVLDLGVGTGDLAARFRRRHPFAPLVVADLAHGMTRHAVARLPGVLPCDADAVNLPLRGESCSLVLSASMYQWVDDLPRAFAEVGRILQPGGSFAFSLFGSETLRELRCAHFAALAEIGGKGRPMHDFPTVQMVAQALDGAGFSGEVTVGYELEEHPDVASLLRALKKIGAQNAVHDRQAGLGNRRQTLRMMEIYTERFAGEEGIPATWEVITGVAVK